MRTVYCYLSIGAAALACACDPAGRTGPATLETPGAMPVETAPDAAPMPEARAGVLATVALAHGGVVTFLDEGDGAVAIAERAPARARLVALSLVQRLDATPLEAYVALAPRGADVPGALVRDHAMRAARAGRPAAAPRALDALAAATPGDLDDVGEGPYECDSTTTAWIDDWKDAFAGVTKYREATYVRYLDLTYTFYPGAAVYHGTNTNSRTYLGVCNGDFHPLGFRVERRVGGVWTLVHHTFVDRAEKYTFHSGVPASYRGRTGSFHGAFSQYFGAGAAWTPSPPLGTTPSPPLGLTP